jgi:S1-C subfamily serine protease
VNARRAVAAGLAAAAAPAGALVLLLPGGVSHAPTRAIEVRVTGPAGVAEVATGFAAGRSRVVTVAHVLNATGTLTVRASGGGPRPARVLRVDRRDDLAVLAVRGLPAAAPSTGAGAGGVWILVRRANRWTALPASVRRHFMAHVHGAPADPVYTRPALELAASVRVGDSGAPVVTPHGKVVGVVFARSDDRVRTAYAVDGKVIAGLLRRAP